MTKVIPDSLKLTLENQETETRGKSEKKADNHSLSLIKLNY